MVLTEIAPRESNLPLIRYVFAFAMLGPHCEMDVVTNLVKKDVSD